MDQKGWEKLQSVISDLEAEKTRLIAENQKLAERAQACEEALDKTVSTLKKLLE